MGFSLRSRKTASADSASTNTAAISSQTSSTTTSALSSRTNSSTHLPDLVSAPTAISSKASFTLTKSKSSSSSIKSLMRTISGKDSMDPMKYAPKKFKFRQPNPQYVAMLRAWDMSENWGASKRRSSWQSGVSPCESRRNSYCYAEQIEDVDEAR